MERESIILIIDDEEGLRLAARAALEQAGHAVLEAPDGEIGLALALKEVPDLVLCDIEMPKRDGYEVLKLFRANPSTATVPFVFFTGRSGKGDMRKGMDLGADDFLTKPFTADELVSTVRSRLGRAARVRDHAKEKLDELRVNISGSVPHELRTPLSGILGFATILKEQAATLEGQELSEIASHILGSARRLQRTLEKFWKYTELVFLARDSRTQESRPSLPAVHLLIRSLARQKAQSAGREADLDLRLEEDIVLAVEESHVSLVVDELLENAFKFSQSGERVVAEYGKAAGAMARFAVKDEGRGMKEAEIENVGGFMQFGRQRHEQQGLGLGLSIVQEIARLYGGTLRISGKERKGTVVEVELPVLR